ncbi:MAG: D-2-hydroxyacid dehydrogenase [Haloferacaceae archaeon]
MPIVIEPTAGYVRAEWLRERLPEATVHEPAREAVATTVDAAEEPVVFLCSNTAWREQYLEALSDGDWVLTTTAGYDGYPADAFQRRGIVLSNCPGISPGTVAEHALGMAISFTRRFDVYRQRQADREWGRRRDDLTDLDGERACVVGLGRVGEAVARRLAAFGATVVGVKRTPEEYDGIAEDVLGPDALLAALDGARLVVLAVPLTEETERLIGAPELAAMDDDGILVNVARGPVLDSEALLAALEEDRLRGAGLDVFEEEPLPADSPLWDREDVFLTPHCAGTTEKYGQRALEIVLDEYRRWRAGEQPRHRVV